MVEIKTIAGIIFILALIGILVSSVSLRDYYEIRSGNQTGPRFCDISNTISCSTVAASPYSELFGIPTSLLGIVWFIGAAIAAYKMHNPGTGFWKKTTTYMFLWSVIGILFVIWFVYVEVVLIGVICLLCTVVHILVIIMFALSCKTARRSVGKYLIDLCYK